MDFSHRLDGLSFFAPKNAEKFDRAAAALRWLRFGCGSTPRCFTLF
jgi:hypothetical protein